MAFGVIGSMLKPEFTSVAESVLVQLYQSDEIRQTLIPLKGGEWSAAYKFHHGGRDYVIRISHTDENFCRDRISSRWSSPELPIPRIIRIGRHQDQFYAISPFVSGEPFESLSASDLEETLPRFLSMMRVLQTINLDSVTGFGSLTAMGQGAFPRWSDALLDVCNDHPDSVMHGWKIALEEMPETQQKYNRFYAQLTRLVPYCPEQKHLIHADLMYHNLMIHEHKVSAVIDWGCAMLGDPAYDLACFALYEPWFPAFTQVNLIHKMQQSYLAQSQENHIRFTERMIAYQIHIALSNIAYCAFSKRKNDLHDHITRLETILQETVC